MNGGGVKKDQTILMSFMDGPYVAYHKLKTAWAPCKLVVFIKVPFIVLLSMYLQVFRVQFSHS